MFQLCRPEAWSKFGRRLARDKRLAVLEIVLSSGFLVGWVLLPIPRTILPFFLFGSMSLWMRGISWRDVGLYRPRSLRLTVLIGTAVSVGISIAGQAVVLPVLTRLTGEGAPKIDAFRSMQSNIVAWLGLVIAMWVLAALMEEMVFRGYFLNRLADLFGQSRKGWLGSLIGSTMLFVVAHGPMNGRVVATTFLMGIAEGSAYLMWKRNLWLPIIIHGASDTISLTLLLLGAT